MTVKLVRDKLGSPVPQSVEGETGEITVHATGDTTGINFGKTKLLRDALGSPIPNQIYDVEQGKWIIGQGGGGGTGAVDSVNGKTGTVVLNANDVGAASATELDTTNTNITNLTGTVSTLSQTVSDNHTQVTSHLAQKVTDENGAHGLKVEKNKIYVENENGAFEELNLASGLLPTAKSFKATDNGDDTVTLSWINPTNSEFKRTQLYKSTQDISSLDLEDMNEPYIELVVNGADESYLHTGVSGTTYYYRLFVIHDFLGEETVTSPSTLTVKIEDFTPPSIVTSVTIKPSNGSLLLTWTNPPEIDLGTIRINYSLNDDITDINSGLMAYNGMGTSTEISDLENDIPVYIRFFTIDNNGNINDDISMKYAATPTSVFEDTTGSPGATSLIAGTSEAGFFGEVSPSELFTVSELSSEVGLTVGINQNETENWLKFVSDRKILFVAKKPLKHSISWDDINNANLVYGSKTVVKDDITYKIRLLKGLTIDTMPKDSNSFTPYTENSEWYKTMIPIHVDSSTHTSNEYPHLLNWNINYTDEDLITHRDKGNGSYSWCQEKGAGMYVNERIICGAIGIGVVGFDTKTYGNAFRGWRPVLEVVTTEGGN